MPSGVYFDPPLSFLHPNSLFPQFWHRKSLAFNCHYYQVHLKMQNPGQNQDLLQEIKIQVFWIFIASSTFTPDGLAVVSEGKTILFDCYFLPIQCRYYMDTDHNIEDCVSLDASKPQSSNSPILGQASKKARTHKKDSESFITLKSKTKNSNMHKAHHTQAGIHTILQHVRKPASCERNSAVI